jgi:hypothetical protein
VGDLTARLGERVPAGWRERLALYGTALLLTYVLFLGSAAWLRLWLVDPAGFPVAGDFVSFWSAGRMAFEGRTADAYDWDLQKAVQLLAIGRPFDNYFAWHNPPTYFLYVAPFALPPYLVGWFLWVVVTFAFFAAMLRLVVPSFLVPALLAAPATVWCAVTGQNGFLTAGLMAGCLVLLDRRPLLAGALLGLLTFKPQFGLLFPVALLAGRRWVAFAAAAATTLLLIALSLAVFGMATWQAFLGSVDKTNDVLLRGGSAWTKLQSAYAIVFQLSGSLRAALIAQVTTTLGLAAALAWLWAKRAPFACKAAALAAASYLATPYAYIYDAPVLATAAAFLLRDGLERGFGRTSKVLIALALLMPAGFLVLGSLAGFAGAVLLFALAVIRAVARGPVLAPART